MAIDLVCLGGTIKCTCCGGRFSRLKKMPGTDEQLCDSCFEGRGGKDYLAALRELNKEFPGIESFDTRL